MVRSTDVLQKPVFRVQRSDGRTTAYVRNPARLQHGVLVESPHSCLPTWILQQPLCCGCHTGWPVDLEERRIQTIVQHKQKKLLQFQTATKERVEKLKTYRKAEDDANRLTQGAYRQQLLREAKRVYWPRCQISIGRRDPMLPLQNSVTSPNRLASLSMTTNLDGLQNRIFDINKKLLNVMDRLTHSKQLAKPAAAVVSSQVSKAHLPWETESNISQSSSTGFSIKAVRLEAADPLDYPLNVHVQHALELRPSSAALRKEKAKQESLMLFRKTLSDDARRRVHDLHSESDREKSVCVADTNAREDSDFHRDIEKDASGIAPVAEIQSTVTHGPDIVVSEVPSAVDNFIKVDPSLGKRETGQLEVGHKTTVDSSSQTDNSLIHPENLFRDKELDITLEEEVLTVCMQYTKGRVMFKYL